MMIEGGNSKFTNMSQYHKDASNSVLLYSTATILSQSKNS
jgi:hypothetical protein